MNNLNNKTQPIFKSVFGDDWDKLPTVIQKHYANYPYTDDVITVKGTLDITCSGPIKILKPLLLLMGSLPAYNQKNVPVTVSFESSRNSKEFRFNRIFYFHENKPYHFRSRMVQVEGNEVVEIMRFNIGWQMNYLWQDNKVILKHKGYVFKLFRYFIPLPITFLLGEGYAEEIAVDDERFNMIVHITHPLFGKIYQYKGQFRLV